MNQRKKEKQIKRNEDNLRDLQDSVKRPNIRIIGVPKKTTRSFFIFNLDVLSTVLYRRRSLETTVKIRLKTRRLKTKITGVPKKGHEKILEEIIVENFPKMGKEIVTDRKSTRLNSSHNA